MASRVAKTALGAARLRPTATVRALPTLASTARYNSSVPAEEPKKKAQSILDSLPGNSLVSKAAILSSGAGASIFALSNEYYVVNEESVVGFSLLAIFFAVGKYLGPAYSGWAEGQISKIRDILNSARADHTEAVNARIQNVKQMGGVVDITKSLFEVSKETAQIEAKVFELEQSTALAAEAKSVLDSWVRYEGQVKQRQQQELAQSIIAKIQKELENPKTLQNILQQSVIDVERIVAQKA
ncbi:hypothetical protein VE02_04049 [Pseudogymnoascus sp. 03VT05]|nr:hypothetical protein VE02_04049 [Pseudogymnoascus sp. 03VT05]